MPAPPAPILPLDPHLARRDPAAIEVDGVVHVFHTVVRPDATPPELWVEVTTSRDLRTWTEPLRVTPEGPNFSSPGNVLRLGGEWVMCLQSYPIRPGEQYGDESCRLWLTRSADLATWSAPEPLRIDGPTADARRIDPFLVADANRLLCLHKADGEIAALESTDGGARWHPQQDGRPLLPTTLTPDGCTVENPAVVRSGAEWLLFASAVGEGRGILLSRSADLQRWSPADRLDLPLLPWAPGGPTAATVLATPDRRAPWTMLLHGDAAGPHGAGLTLLVASAPEGPYRPL